MPDPDHADAAAPDRAASPPPFGFHCDPRQWVIAANAIAARLADGTYPPGQWLPLGTRISASIGLSPTVIYQALAEAAGKGLITRVHGQGYYAGTGPLPSGPPPRLARATPPPRPAGPRARRARPRYDLPARLTERYLTIADLAAILRIPRPVIARLTDDGAFEGAIRVGGSVRVPARSADAYLATCLITPAAPPVPGGPPA